MVEDEVAYTICEYISHPLESGPFIHDYSIQEKPRHVKRHSGVFQGVLLSSALTAVEEDTSTNSQQD